ncbi:outer membrane beta-barrel protein [candidate division KSB1 bacterium]
MKTKSALLGFLFLCVITSDIVPQETPTSNRRLYFKAGTGFTTYRIGSDVTSDTRRSNFLMGMGWECNLQEQTVCCAVEMVLSNKAFAHSSLQVIDASSNWGKISINNYYLTVPVLLRYNFTKQNQASLSGLLHSISPELGFEPQLLFLSDSTIEGGDFTTVTGIRGVAFNAVAGCGFTVIVKSTAFRFGLRYVHGISSYRYYKTNRGHLQSLMFYTDWLFRS